MDRGQLLLFRAIDENKTICDVLALIFLRLRLFVFCHDWPIILTCYWIRRLERVFS